MKPTLIEESFVFTAQKREEKKRHSIPLFILSVVALAMCAFTQIAHAATATATAAGQTKITVKPQQQGRIWKLADDTYYKWFEEASVACPSGPAGPQGSALTNKVGAFTRSSGVIPCPGGEGNGEGRATWVGTSDYLKLDYAYTNTAIATKLVSPPLGPVTTVAKVKDPTLLEIGSQNTSLLISQTLQRGTEIQRHNFADPNAPVPYIDLKYRFAIGDYIGASPNKLWPDSGPPPANSFDPVDVRLFENTTGNIQAVVTLDTNGVQAISASFSRTAPQLEALLEGADWVKGAEDWTLQGNLSLFDLTLTNTNDAIDPAGTPAAFGFLLTETASVDLPEPSSLLLLGSGVLGLSGFLRQRLLTRR